MDAVVVVAAQVAFGLAAQTSLLGDEKASEGRLPSRIEDRALPPLNAAVGLRPAGMDESLAGAEPTHGLRGVQAAWH